ncbi:MAG: glycosyltransferase family 4 protein [Chloroflexota bacterium]
MSQTQRTHILQLVASAQGGAATHLRDLVLGLPSDRFQSTAGMPLDNGNVTPADFQEAGHKFIEVPIDRGLAWREINRLRLTVEKLKIDMIHAHGARAAMYARLMAGGAARKIPVVFSIHGFATPFYSFPKRNIYLHLERRLQRATSHTIAVAQAEADLFLSFGLTTADKLSVISYGIDVERFMTATEKNAILRTEFGLKSDNKVILTVCRLHVPRDFETLFEAFKQVQDEMPEARLLIVGDGPQRVELEVKIQQMGLSKLVRITGYRTDIPQLMQLADIYTLTSYGWEGFPISTMEAQAAGTPVVVTDAGGSREAVRHEETGLVVPLQNPVALAEAYRRLLNDDQFREQLGVAGKRRAEMEFTREAMVQRIVDIYDQVI